MSVPQNIGVHDSNHGHAFTDEDWTAMLDFLDMAWHGKPAKQRFDRFPE